jgi:hypothetical protein
LQQKIDYACRALLTKNILKESKYILPEAQFLTPSDNDSRENYLQAKSLSLNDNTVILYSAFAVN